MQNTNTTDVDPELWQPGEVHTIPRIRGRAYPCTVTRVLPSVVEFRGPTGPGSITKDLYRKLVSR